MAGELLLCVEERFLDYAPQAYNVNAQQIFNYPSEFWEGAAVRQRPTINISRGSVAHAYAVLSGMYAQHTWNDVAVSSFMWKVIAHFPRIFQETLTEAWVASGVQIAAAGPCTPNDILIEIPVGDGPAAEDIIDPVTDETLLSLFWATLKLARKIHATGMNAQYGALMGRRLDDFFEANRMIIDPIHAGLVAEYRTEDKLTPQYKKILCILDMFFYKFQLAEYSSMRIATLQMRFAGCVALTSLGQISKVTGLSVGEIAHYLFLRHVALEMGRISHPGQHAGELHGYFPYQLGLGLVVKTGYSMSINPSLFLFFHVLGSILGYERSIKAAMPDAQNLTGIVQNAACLALHLGAGGSVRRYYVGDEESRERARRQTAAMEGGIPALRRPGDNLLEEEADDFGSDSEDGENAFAQEEGISAHEARVTAVLRELSMNNGLSPEHARTFHQRCRALATAPPKTVGHHLYTLQDFIGADFSELDRAARSAALNEGKIIEDLEMCGSALSKASELIAASNTDPDESTQAHFPDDSSSNIAPSLEEADIFKSSPTFNEITLNLSKEIVVDLAPGGVAMSGSDAVEAVLCALYKYGEIGPYRREGTSFCISPQYNDATSSSISVEVSIQDLSESRASSPTPKASSEKIRLESEELPPVYGDDTDRLEPVKKATGTIPKPIHGIPNIPAPPPPKAIVQAVVEQKRPPDAQLKAMWEGANNPPKVQPKIKPVATSTPKTQAVYETPEHKIFRYLDIFGIVNTFKTRKYCLSCPKTTRGDREIWLIHFRDTHSHPSARLLTLNPLK